MDNAIHGINSVQLYELLSFPIIAMIQADAQAARATVDFIESIGFNFDVKRKLDSSFGSLRMIDFSYQKIDENNNISEFRSSVPLLSLMPIPSLQIQEAKINLTAKITDIAIQNVKDTSSNRTLKSKFQLSNLKQTHIYAKPVAASGSKNEEIRASYDLTIEMKLGQADIAIGLERILQTLDQAINERKIEK